MQMNADGRKWHLRIDVFPIEKLVQDVARIPNARAQIFRSIPPNQYVR